MFCNLHLYLCPTTMCVRAKILLHLLSKKSYYLKSQLDAKMCKRHVYEQPLKSISNQFLFGENWLYEYRLIIGAGRTPPPPPLSIFCLIYSGLCTPFISHAKSMQRKYSQYFSNICIQYLYTLGAYKGGGGAGV